MARLYGNRLKRHKDTIPKRMLSEGDVKFLKDLQREMNTQNHVGQRDPRYWVIRETVRQFNLEEGEELLIDDETGEEYETKEGILAYIDRVAKEAYTNGKAQLAENGLWIDLFEDGVNVETLFDFSDTAEWLNEHGERVHVTHFEDIRKIHSGPIFLTLRDAETHLKKNYYHYAEDASAYAMTAWRDPTIEKLYQILQETDWDSVRKEGRE